MSGQIRGFKVIQVEKEPGTTVAGRRGGQPACRFGLGHSPEPFKTNPFFDCLGLLVLQATGLQLIDEHMAAAAKEDLHPVQLRGRQY